MQVYLFTQAGKKLCKRKLAIVKRGFNRGKFIANWSDSNAYQDGMRSLLTSGYSSQLSFTSLTQFASFS